MDSRVVKKIMKSPRMMAEQGDNWLQYCGGPQNYVAFARMPTNERLVYAAYMDGLVLPDQIEAATGVPSREARDILLSLQRQGLVEPANEAGI